MYSICWFFIIRRCSKSPWTVMQVFKGFPPAPYEPSLNQKMAEIAEITDLLWFMICCH